MYTKEELEQKVKNIPYWYHKIDLPFGITTPGWAPINKDAYRVPADLSGKRVLDIGAWDGFWSFEALKRGAREVVAIDDFSDYLGKLENKDRSAWESFDLCRSALGYAPEICKRQELTVYELKEEEIGTFDMVFFFGTLYHLRYPLLALDKISAVCKGAIYVESAILDDYSPYRGGLNKGYPGSQRVMEFYPDREYAQNETNWWVPTVYCLMSLLGAAGFENITGWKLTDSPKVLAECRGFASGTK